MCASNKDKAPSCNQEKNDVILYSCLSGIIIPMWEMKAESFQIFAKIDIGLEVSM